MFQLDVSRTHSLHRAVGTLFLHEDDPRIARPRPPHRLHERQRPLGHVVADHEAAVLHVEALLSDGGREERVAVAAAEEREHLVLLLLRKKPRLAHQRIYSNTWHVQQCVRNMQRW